MRGVYAVQSQSSEKQSKIGLALYNTQCNKIQWLLKCWVLSLFFFLTLSTCTFGDFICWDTQYEPNKQSTSWLSISTSELPCTDDSLRITGSDFWSFKINKPKRPILSTSRVGLALSLLFFLRIKFQGRTWIVELFQNYNLPLCSVE